MTAALKNGAVLEVGAQLQRGAIDPIAMAEERLAAIAACEDQAIFTCTTPERALAEAEQSSRRIRDGQSLSLLDGVPVAWKDLFDIEGITTTAGSTILSANPPATADAEVVARLKAAGMVTLGRVNMTEFAFSAIGLNPHFGTPRNPHGKDMPRVPGGSSSGSAVAVARGLVPISIGSDTGGSVRIPAAFNGLVGYKATRGRYPMDGVFPLAPSLDSLGILVRTVADAIAVDAALCGRAAANGDSVSLGRLRLLVPTNVVFDDVEPGVASAFEIALERLRAAGVRVERQVLPQLDEVLELNRRHGAIVTAEAYALHEERLASPSSAQMDQRVAARARSGAHIRAADYIKIVQARTALIASARQTIGPDRLIAYPTVAHVAPPLARLEEDDELFTKVNGMTLRNTMLGNFLDWCGISIPCGTGEAGMPVGFLLSGLPGEDDSLMLAARDMQTLLDGSYP